MCNSLLIICILNDIHYRSLISENALIKSKELMKFSLRGRFLARSENPEVGKCALFKR